MIKEALIKKFGNEWFLELERIAKNKNKQFIEEGYKYLFYITI